jgi:thioredoxin 2
MMAPVLDRLAARRRTSLRVAKVDTDAEQALAGRFGIRSIPTLILFENGRERARQSGALDPAALDRWLDSTLAN